MSAGVESSIGVGVGIDQCRTSGCRPPPASVPCGWIVGSRLAGAAEPRRSAESGDDGGGKTDLT